MNDSPQPGNERRFSPEDMVTASELREFLYCERAWFLGKEGFRVSAAAQSHRNAGIGFHKARALAADRGRSAWPRRWAVIFVLAGIALLLLELWMNVK